MLAAVAAMATAPNPIRIEVRAPKITRLKTSLPWTSVPNGWVGDGPIRRFMMS